MAYTKIIRFDREPFRCTSILTNVIRGVLDSDTVSGILAENEGIGPSLCAQSHEMADNCS